MKYIKCIGLFESLDYIDNIVSDCRYILLDLDDMGISTYIRRRKENSTSSSGSVVSIYQIHIYVNNLVGVDDSHLIDTRSRLVDYLSSEGFDYISSSGVESFPNYGNRVVQKDGISRHNLWKFRKEE